MAPITPLYFAKFTFSEIICFAKRPSPGLAVLRRVVASGGIVMVSARLIGFYCSSMDRNQYARCFCVPTVRRCGPCLRVSHGYFAGFGSLHRYFPAIIYSEFVVANAQPRDARNCALSPGKQCGEYPVGFWLPVSIGNLCAKILKYIVSQNKPGLRIIPVSPGLYHGSTLL